MDGETKMHILNEKTVFTFYLHDSENFHPLHWHIPYIELPNHEKCFLMELFHCWTNSFCCNSDYCSCFMMIVFSSLVMEDEDD